jgi:cytochrome c-type biogenesis protein CcmH/NrfF
MVLRGQAAALVAWAGPVLALLLRAAVVSVLVGAAVSRRTPETAGAAAAVAAAARVHFLMRAVLEPSSLTLP